MALYYSLKRKKWKSAGNRVQNFILIWVFRSFYWVLFKKGKERKRKKKKKKNELWGSKTQVDGKRLYESKTPSEWYLSRQEPMRDCETCSTRC
jgi:hypothetical protein